MQIVKDLFIFWRKKQMHTKKPERRIFQRKIQCKY